MLLEDGLSFDDSCSDRCASVVWNEEDAVVAHSASSTRHGPDIQAGHHHGSPPSVIVGMVWSNCGSRLCSAMRMRLGPTGGGWVPHHFGLDVGIWTVLVERNPPTSLDLLVSSLALFRLRWRGERWKWKWKWKW